MLDTLQKTFKFSETFLKVEYLENLDTFQIGGPTIVLNAGNHELSIQGHPLRPWNSSIYSAIVIANIQKIVGITLEPDLLFIKSFPYEKTLREKWTHVHELFPLAHLKQTKLWRSAQERIGQIEFNLWYAPAGTHCGIHNQHDFQELHPQIFGRGRMQKFHENDYNSLYQEVFMSPGYTHEPFYDHEGRYPWHQYYADTDCIWLATEFHRMSVAPVGNDSER